eukprot:jgi/Ulvmu1/2803/UM141_0012.1
MTLTRGLALWALSVVLLSSRGCSAQAASTQIRFVTTPQELRQATLEEVKHIVLTEHIDLTDNDGVTLSGDSPNAAALVPSSKTISITGMCSGPAPSFASSALLAPNVCAIAVEEGFVHVPSSAGPSSLWLDKLYVTLSGDIADDEADPGTLVLQEAGQLYMTNVTFDGRDRHARAVYLATDVAMGASELHAQGCTFRDCHHSHGAGALIGPGNVAAFSDCSFVGNALIAAPMKDAGGGASVIFGTAIAARPNATALFRGCTFRQNAVLADDGVSVMETDPTPKTVSAAGGPAPAVVAAEPDAIEVWDYSAGAPRMSDAWNASLDGTASAVGLIAIQSDFVRAFQESGDAAAITGAVSAPAAPPPASGGGSHSDEYRTMVVVLASVLGSLLLAIVVGTVVAVRQWRRVANPFFSWSNTSSSCRDVLVDEASRDVASSHAISMHGPGSLAASGSVAAGAGAAVPSPRPRQALPPIPAINGPSWDPSTATVTPTASAAPSAAASAGPSAAPSSDLPRTPRAWSQSSKSLSNTLGTNDMSIFRAGHTGARSKGVRSRAVSVLSNVFNGITSRTSSVKGDDTSRSFAQTATIDRTAVEVVLDAMVATGMPFLMQYVLEGAPVHRGGSRGLVQFAKSRLTGERVAVKFFLDENAFRCEEAAYAQPELKPLMDSVLLMNLNEAKVQVPRGRQGAAVESLPPCIVYEEGEPLDAWMGRARPDLNAMLHVLCSIAQRVADIHHVGFVHRDLKPSNVLWRAGEAAWTVTDFGCAAPMGYMTKITDSKVYVPPETLFAHSVNAHSVSVDAAADVWALGVLMLELFSGTPSAAAHAPVSTFVPSSGTATIAGGTGSIATASVVSGPVEDDAARLTRALFERLESVSLPRIYGAPVTAEIANELRALRLKMAGCLAREPVRRPTVAQLVGTLQKTRDALHAAAAANVWMPRDGLAALPQPRHAPPRTPPAALAAAAAAAVAAAPAAAVADAAAGSAAESAAESAASGPPPARALPPLPTPAPESEPAPSPASPPAVAEAEPAQPVPPSAPEAPAVATAAAPPPAGATAAATAADTPAELRGKPLTGMLDSDARVAKCEAWVARMHEVTQDRPTMTVTLTDDDATPDSPPRRATAPMFGPTSGLAVVRSAAREGDAATEHSMAAEGARHGSGPEAAPFVPPDAAVNGGDSHTREVTPLVTSPLELKADSTLDSELAGGGA